MLGIVGAWLGWWVFTGLLGIGDDDMFDLGGIIGAILGAIIVLAVVTWLSAAAAGRAPRGRDRWAA